MNVPAMTAITLAAFALAGPSSVAQEPGTPYCFGTQCPCGNNDPTGGCINSSGQGALLTAAGSTSVAADDLVFTVTRMSLHSVSLLIMSDTQAMVPFFNGQLCLGGGLKRMFKHLNSGHAGSVTFESIVEGYQETNVIIRPGDTSHFQVWFRDVPAHLTACGASANMTNGYMVVFTP